VSSVDLRQRLLTSLHAEPDRRRRSKERTEVAGHSSRPCSWGDGQSRWRALRTRVPGNCGVSPGGPRAELAPGMPHPRSAGVLLLREVVTIVRAAGYTVSHERPGFVARTLPDSSLPPGFRASGSAQGRRRLRAHARTFAGGGRKILTGRPAAVRGAAGGRRSNLPPRCSTLLLDEA